MLASKTGAGLGIASRIQSLPPFAPAACRLVQLIQQETAHFHEASRILAVDPALSTQVLRVANSALFGRRYEIASIVQALCLVGADRLRDIVLIVAIKNYMGDEDNLFLQRSWRHSLATAVWCEKLAEEYGVDRPIGYTAGILHDIGRTALLKLFPHEYATFMATALTGDLDKLDAERALCDVDHCQVGESLAEGWNFPPVLADVIAYHHEPVTAGTPRSRLLVQAACAAANLSGFHAIGPEREWDPSQIESLLPPRQPARRLNYEEMLEDVAFQINQTECSLL